MRPNKVWLRTARGRVVDIDCMAPGGDVWRMYREHTVESARLTTVTDASAGPARGKRSTLTQRPLCQGDPLPRFVRREARAAPRDD